MDLLISGGVGLVLCRSIRERSSIPIAAVSAFATSDEAIEAGADAFPLKPLEPLQFVHGARSARYQHLLTIQLSENGTFDVAGVLPGTPLAVRPNRAKRDHA